MRATPSGRGRAGATLGAALVAILGITACRGVDATAPPDVPPDALPALQRDVAPVITLTDLGPVAGGGWTGPALAINNPGVVVGYIGDAYRWTARDGARRLDLGGSALDPGAHDVNEGGDIVGAGCIPPNGPCHAFLLTRAGQLLEFVDPALGVLHAINDAGVAVGAGGGRAAVWSAREGVRWLDGGWFALDISARGDVVGQAVGARAALWPRGGPLVVLPTPAGVEAVASGINNRGDVVGFIGPHFASTGFVWSERDGLRLLETPAGWYGHPEAINNRGEIAGWITTGGSMGFTRAVLWTPTGELVPLGGLPTGGRSAAYDLNERGQVVGGVETADGAAHGARWTVAGGSRSE